jgi:cytochrome b561
VKRWHKWAGVSMLALTALRLLWRLSHRPPAPAAMPLWQRRASSASHGLMYALFFAIALPGWTCSSAAGFPIVCLGVLPLPDFVPVDKALAALVVRPIGAAFQHHFMRRDGLLSRMRP